MMMIGTGEGGDKCCAGIGVVADPQKRGAVFETKTVNGTTRLSFCLLTSSKLNAKGEYESKLHTFAFYINNQNKNTQVYEQVIRRMRRGDKMLFFGSFRRARDGYDEEIRIELIANVKDFVGLTPGEEQETVKGKRYIKDQIGEDIPFL